MIKVIIIDDEANSIELIANLLRLSGKEIKIIATANSVASGYQCITKNDPDLVFLDVQMQDGTGFELLNKLGELAFKVIFITAHQEFAIKAFKYSALDYLLKPLSPIGFMDAISKAENTLIKYELDLKLKTLLHNVSEPLNQNKKIVLKTLEKVYAINTGDIIRMESEGSYTTIYLNGGKRIIVSKLIKDFEEMLSDNGFVRIHQSHLINMEYFFCYEKAEHMIIMKDESIVPVSTRKKEFVMKLIHAA